jgi:hypothetical protein
MLVSLGLKNVGPAPEMAMELGPRLNVITGDNGLGKSFLLDVAWWALTEKWLQEVNPELTSGYVPRPTLAGEPASISFRVALEANEQTANQNEEQQVTYDPGYRSWNRDELLGRNPGLVLYALADGGFAIWDAARNSGGIRYEPILGKSGKHHDRVPAYVFSAKEIWDGLRVDIDGKHTVVCNGLLADWASWIRERGADARRMAAVLAKLAPIVGANALEVSSEFARLSMNDVRDIPLLRMGYGQEVPVLYASLGVRRIAALAYAMSWAWREHVIASKQLGAPPSSHIVLLFDELEAHLHPRWQRAIAPALLEVMATLTGNVATSVQLIATTHSPLVLASLEPNFDEKLDKLFTLEQSEGRKRAAGHVELHEQAWAKQGDVVNWLVSESFGLKQGRSLEAERAIEAAEAWMRKEQAALPVGLKTKAQIHAELLRTLAGHDEFWPRWVSSEPAPQPVKVSKGKGGKAKRTAKATERSKSQGIEIVQHAKSTRSSKPKSVRRASRSKLAQRAG